MAAELHRASRDQALARVEDLFGEAGEWRSPLIQYRLSSDFQSDWKEEVGHWLLTAERLGFLDPLIARVIKRAKRGTRSEGIDPNDRRHNELVAELAPAMVAHYLEGTGWAFQAWEPLTGGQVDVDLALAPPTGGEVYVQVKAPDQPGGRANHRVVDGEYDDRVVAAVENAAGQLPRKGDSINLIAVCANRIAPLSQNPRCLVKALVGAPLGTGDGGSVLTEGQYGRFFASDWVHVSGVVMIDYLRGIDTFKYACTVLLNPVATVTGDPEWFPYARVAHLDGDAFQWVRGEPGRAHGLRPGTVVAGF